MTPISLQIKGSFPLISRAHWNDNKAVFKLFVRKYSIPMYKCAAKHLLINKKDNLKKNPGNNRDVVR